MHRGMSPHRHGHHVEVEVHGKTAPTVLAGRLATTMSRRNAKLPAGLPHGQACPLGDKARRPPNPVQPPVPIGTNRLGKHGLRRLHLHVRLRISPGTSAAMSGAAADALYSACVLLVRRHPGTA